MTLAAQSRYITYPSALVDYLGDGPRLTIMLPDKQAETISYTEYLISAAYRIDQIAEAAYGDGTLWWAIADANPEITDYWNLRPGQTIRIPLI